MKKLFLSLVLLCMGMSMAAETVVAHYYGSEIDLTRKNNPCKGNTDGGVEVIVETRVNAVDGCPSATVVERIYSLPNGEVLKHDSEVIKKPKAEVLHKLFPRNYPKVKR